MRDRHVVAMVLPLLGLAVLGLAAWCGWVSGFHRSTTADEVTWACSLSAVVLVDLALWRGREGARWAPRLRPASEPWPRRGEGGGRRALRGVAPWLALVAVAVTWDVLGIDSGPHQYHLTLSALAQAYRPLNAALVLMWMLIGVGYEAARVRALPGRSAARVLPEGPGGGTVVCGAAGLVGRGGRHFGPALLLPPHPGAGVAFWVSVFLVAVLIDGVARRTQGSMATAEEFVRFISTSPLANLALIAAWLAAGYHLFAR